jgi:reactive chlorine resistance protein C
MAKRRISRVTSTDGTNMTIQLNTANIRQTISRIDTIAPVLGRYGLVVVIAWIGALKFTAYEAKGIQPLVANSPFMSWLYEIFTVNTFSAVLGVVEITTAVLLAVKPLYPRLSVLGSAMAVGLFLATITFLFTTPGVGEATAGGFPVLSATGQFLIKDVALLGLSAWTLADSLRAVMQRSDA